MEAYRFYVPGLKQAGKHVRLSEEETHHADRVLRLEAGAPVEVFDGCGAWAVGKLLNERNGAIELKGGVHSEAEPALRLTLATAVPKGERADWLIEQVSQLGIWRVRFVACDRSVVKPRDDGEKMEKWRRLTVESAKQCGRNHVMLIKEIGRLEDVLSGSWRKVVWLDPKASKPVTEVMRDLTSGDILALVGPEGGWSKHEREKLESAGEAMLLTKTVLRIETACAALAAVVMAR